MPRALVNHSNIFLLAFVAAIAVCNRGDAAPAEKSPTIAVEFGPSIQTETGGFFRCFGGSPHQVTDELTNLGDPKYSVWRIELSARAPARGAGALFPLFDERRANSAALPGIATNSCLHVRLCGLLDDRRLRIELVPGANPEAHGIHLGVVEPQQLDDSTWHDLRLQVPPIEDRWDGGFIRILAEGRGAAWFAIDSLRISPQSVRLSRHDPPHTLKHSLRTALWVWSTAEILADADRAKALLAFCSRHEITDLFCQVPYRYDQGAVDLFLAEQQAAFNAAASRRGIAIHALDGSPEYVLPENHLRMTRLLDAIGSWNATVAPNERYSGIHLDNEPYVLPEWRIDSDRQRLIDNYIRLNQELGPRAQALGLEFGVDIPFWWDKRDETGSPLYWFTSAGGRQPMLDVLFSVVQNVGIMSYRDRVTGPNGIVAQCLDEFELGKRFGVDVFAAVELGTGADVEASTTLGAYSKKYCRMQLETLRQVLSCTTGCAGIAIHYYEPYAELDSSP